MSPIKWNCKDASMTKKAWKYNFSTKCSCGWSCLRLGINWSEWVSKLSRLGVKLTFDFKNDFLRPLNNQNNYSIFHSSWLQGNMNCCSLLAVPPAFRGWGSFFNSSLSGEKCLINCILMCGSIVKLAMKAKVKATLVWWNSSWDLGLFKWLS